MIKVKRIYEAPAGDDGLRIFVERLWPRGLSKEKANFDVWLKEIAPSHELRKWYHHGAGDWEAFRQRYWEELRQQPEALENLHKLLAEHHQVTFVYAARNEEQNSAIALKDFLETQ